MAMRFPKDGPCGDLHETLAFGQFRFKRAPRGVLMGGYVFCAAHGAFGIIAVRF